MRERAALAGVLAAAAMLAGASDAHAGGLGRPNVVSARAIGWGGAFTAVADDATALHFNPAGMASQTDDSVYIGSETILAPRSYKPLESDGSLGAAQVPKNAPAFLPVLGYVTRVHQDGLPSRWAFGVGFWNTFGGGLEYEKGDPTQKAVNSTSIALLELVPGLAYEVNDFLQVGATFRLGLGVFSVDATHHPTASANISTSGVGAGFSAGAMISPSSSVRIGLVWRSSLNVDTKGSGDIDFGDGMPKKVDASLEEDWPQQAALGVYWKATPRLGFSLQGDWTDWSSMQKLVIVAAGATDVNDLDFSDTWAGHVGLQYAISDGLAWRAGYTLDGNAVPDRTIDRTFLDQPKHCVATGATWKAKSWLTIDAAFEAVFGPVRHVPDNSDQYTGFPTRANVAPGDHQGQIYTLELAAELKY